MFLKLPPVKKLGNRKLVLFDVAVSFERQNISPNSYALGAFGIGGIHVQGLKKPRFIRLQPECLLLQQEPSTACATL